MAHCKIHLLNTLSASKRKLDSIQITKSSIWSRFCIRSILILIHSNILIHLIIIIIIMPSVDHCCHCPKRIGTKERRFKISEPSLLPYFKKFVGEEFALYDEANNVLCQKCRMKTFNATKRKKVDGNWTYEKPTPSSHTSPFECYNRTKMFKRYGNGYIFR
jgi:hypothetical protein